jgi:outer membrane biogenesis lipoprotein LolB
MLARNSLSSRVARVALVAFAAALFGACAQKEQVTLVNDPSTTGRESALPWNQQQKWEGQGQFGGMAERMGGGSRR